MKKKNIRANMKGSPIFLYKSVICVTSPNCISLSNYLCQTSSQVVWGHSSIFCFCIRSCHNTLFLALPRN